MPGLVANAINTIVDLGLPSIIASLAGVLIGWQLTVRSAAKARREEWRRADERAIELRLRDLADELHGVLADMEGLRLRRPLEGARPDATVSVARCEIEVGLGVV